MEDLLNRIKDKNEKEAFDFTKQILVESASSDKYLSLIPSFAEMLEDTNSYIRTRAFLLICSQARWASNGQIKVVFNQMLLLLNDSKPTVVRQCLKALHEVVLFRPELSDEIKNALDKIDLSNYKESMSPLIEKDIDELQSLL